MAYLGNAPVVGDSTNSFRLLDDIASFTVTFDATDTSIVSISGDTLSFTNHRFVTGQKVTYTDGGGTAIGGLTDGTSYFIIKVDQNTIKLATNASNAASSTAINLTSGAAGGSHTLKVAFDGVNTKFKATFNNGKKAKISRAAQISLSINGVIQQPQDSSSPSVGYGVEADSTIVFSTAPAATDKVFASFIGEVAASFDLTDNTIDNFTGDGSTTIFNLSKEVPSSEDVLVTLDGVTQHPSDASTTRSYSVIDQALTFVSAPATGVAIQARHIGFAGASTSAVTGFYGRTGNAALINTDDISVQNISAGIATFSGNVSIAGTLTYEDVTNIDSVGLVTARNGIVVGSGITLSKDGDGFFTGIITASSYSGIDLSAVTGATGDFSIADKIVHTGDTDTLIRFPSADNIQFDVAGVERLRVDNSDGVIAKHTTAANLRIQNSTEATSQVAQLDMAPAGSASGVQLKCTSEEDFSTGANRTAFFTVDVRQDGTFHERFRIQSDGRVAINDTGNANYTTFSPCLAIGDSGDSTPGLVLRGSATSNCDISFCDNSGTESDDGVSEGLIRYEHSNDAMIFHTADGERLRIGSSGQFGLGGTNYGTSGQVLTSQGSGSAAVWSTITAAISSIADDQANRILTSDGDGTATAETDFTVASNRLTCRHTTSGTTYPLFIQNRTNDDSRAGIQFIATGSDISDGQFATIEARGPQAGNTRHMLYFKTCTSGGTPTDRLYIDSDGHVYPAADNSYNLGGSSLRWSNIYTADLKLSNEGSTNDVDGTWGNYTIQEGESDLFLINNRSGKKYKFNLTEVS